MILVPHPKIMELGPRDTPLIDCSKSRLLVIDVGALTVQAQMPLQNAVGGFHCV
jgi:hypothetical protein